MMRYTLRYQALVMLLDVALVAAALYGSYLLRIHLPFGIPGPDTAFEPPAALYPVAVLIWWLCLDRKNRTGAFNRPHVVSALSRLLRDHAVACLMFLGVLYIGWRDFSRLQSVFCILLLLAGLVSVRCALLFGQKMFNWQVNRTRRVLIIGTDTFARGMGDHMHAYSSAGVELVGYVALDGQPSDADSPTPIATLDTLTETVRALAVDDVIIANRWFDQASSLVVDRVNHALIETSAAIRFACDYAQFAYFRVQMEDMGSVTLVSLRETILSPIERHCKRALDILVALAALIITLPLMAAIALLIRLDSPGPVVFRQERVGQYGKRFTMYKFRTMRADPDGESSPYVPADKSRPDPRVTPIGRVLRQTSMDELPQFWNVLIGDMSVVGPRPEVASVVADYVWWQRKRLEVPQGITGWWQTHGRANHPLQQDLSHDMYYIAHYSLWLDLMIILRTIPVVLLRRGAY